MSLHGVYLSSLMLMAATTAISASPSAAAKTARLVVGDNKALNADDLAIRKRLNYYYTVSVADDSAPAVFSNDLIVIAPSASPNVVATKYRQAPRGVLVTTPALYDDMGMTAAGAFGTVTGSAVRMVDATHQLSAGWASGASAPVYRSAAPIGWGTPAASARRVALVADGNTSRATIFGYEAGDVMTGGFVAPARRVGFFLGQGGGVTGDGWSLFDYAADYADGTVPPVDGGSTSAITWSPNVLRLARGCDAWTPASAPDGHLYILYGDCSGVTGRLKPKRSMGYGRVSGSPAAGNVSVADIDTGAPGAPDIDRTDSGGGLDAIGEGERGKKPASLLHVGDTMYAWVRNVGGFGLHARLRHTQAYNVPNATWTWADWTLTEFGQPTFVQHGSSRAEDGFIYVVAHDNPSAYRPADRFVLMRVPADRVLDQSAYEFFSGTPGSPSWASFAERGKRTAIFTSKGRCRRSGMTHNAARGRYYWWQRISASPSERPSTPDGRFFGGFGVYSAPEPWGPWIPVYYTEAWDIGPGERGEFPAKWMDGSPLGTTGEMHLVFSGDDHLAIRKGTIAPGF